MKNETVNQLLAKAIAADAMPGAVYLTGTRETVLAEEALGHLDYDAETSSVTPDTIYDLASLTKTIVTTPLAMLLYEQGQLDLEAPVNTYIPEFSGDGKDNVVIADLLAHCGGLLWWTDLYKSFGGRSQIESKRGYIDKICELPLDYLPRSKSIYSDLGFLLLGEVLERLTQSTLDLLATNEIFTPLGMEEIWYNPPERLLSRIAPTEKDKWRGSMLRGVVHDENAYGLGGIAPHAGLFSTARAIAPIARMFLNEGVSNNHRLVTPETVQLFTQRANLVAGSSRALGWDTPAAEGSSGGLFSPVSYGHTGFTGTSLWIDPSRNFFAILLTNRIHPTRENPKLSSLRPRFHDALVKALDTS